MPDPWEYFRRRRSDEPLDQLGSRWVSDIDILCGWLNGQDTHAIAQKYFVHESTVANRLPRILQDYREREGQL